MDELLTLDATAQLQALARKRVSAVELLKATHARHEATHAKLNAVVQSDIESALIWAGGVDEARARGDKLGPLAGLPMTVKDTFDLAGMPASSGLDHLRQRQCSDAAVVAHARKAGAVIWGKSNTPVLAGDWQTFNRVYGTTNNPWDVSRTPGGSSGGAAAALAARVTALEIGSDIGGSLRVPSTFCGTFSHKPTWGRLRQHGHVPPQPGIVSERDLNVAGPMARSARDLKLLLSVLEGAPVAKAAPADLKSARIALWTEEPIFPLDPEVKAAVEGLARELEAAGAQVTPIRSPVDMKALFAAYQTLLGAVLSEDLPPAAIRQMELMRGPAKLALRNGAGTLSWAAMVMAYTARHREWLAADHVRCGLRQEIRGLFESYDAILAPITPVAAFPHDQRPFEKRRLVLSTGEKAPYTAMLCWVSLATALHLPATTVPAGRTPAGLPVGAQIIGPLGGDATTLALAQAIDEQIRGFEPPGE